MTSLVFKLHVQKSPTQCYQFWTHVDDLSSFFSPNVNIEAYPGGKFEILFDMDQEEGQRGSEGCSYFVLEESKTITFSWNSPPILSSIRNQKTLVKLSFEPSPDGCSLTFEHMWMGQGPFWQKNREYFARAWGAIVLPRFKAFCEGKSIHWNDPSQFPPLTPQ